MTVLAALVAVIVSVVAFSAGYGLGRAAGEGARPQRFYRPRFRFGIGPFQRKESDMQVNLTNEQKVKLTVNPVTAAGHPAQLDGPVSFSVESGECTIEPVDERSCYIVSGDLPGDSVVVASADADLGDGVVNVAASVDVHVEGAMASSLGLALGTPEAK